MQGTWIPSLVRGLRSYLNQNAAKNKFFLKSIQHTPRKERKDNCSHFFPWLWELHFSWWLSFSTSHSIFPLPSTNTFISKRSESSMDLSVLYQQTYFCFMTNINYCHQNPKLVLPLLLPIQWHKTCKMTRWPSQLQISGTIVQSCWKNSFLWLKKTKNKKHL